MNLRKQFAQNIIDHRKSTGLSQEALAKLAGVSRSHLGKIENARHSTSIDTVNKIADALGVDASVLFEG